MKCKKPIGAANSIRLILASSPPDCTTKRGPAIPGRGEPAIAKRKNGGRRFSPPPAADASRTFATPARLREQRQNVVSRVNTKARGDQHGREHAGQGKRRGDRCAGVS